MDICTMALDNAILHLDLDTFFVSVERLMDSRLNGLPIILGGLSDRGVVASCSYEARRYGVHSGMPMKMARQLCPEAVFIRGNTSNYTQYSKLITEIIREEVPLFEKASIDEFYVDLTGMDKYFGCYQFATNLRKRITRESGLPISFGLSTNKTVAKVATGEAKPNNQMQVPSGVEKPFLAPLSVKKIPGVGDKTFQTLCNMGVKHIHPLQEMPSEMMLRALGKSGLEIWKRANAIDRRAIVPFTERKSISTERTFSKDTTDVRMLKTLIRAMVDNLAYQLRRGGKLTSCVAVKIRYSDFNTYTKQKKIAYTSADHVLLPLVMDLFEQLYQRRLLIRLIGVRFSDLTYGHYQINLFDDSEKMIELYKAMDDIRHRFNQKIIGRASAMGAKTIGGFNPFNGEPPTVLAHRRQ